MTSLKNYTGIIQIFRWVHGEHFTFVADDCDNEFLGSNTHMWQADSLANIIDDNVQNFNINKIFLDNYNQISTPGGPSPLMPKLQ